LIIANLVNTVPPILAISIMRRHITGIIQKVDAQTQEAELLQSGKAKPLRFTWDSQTKFITRLEVADAAMLRPGALVEIICYHPFIGGTYVTKVTLLSGVLTPYGKNTF
jgi:hypothetical protein